jgi:hypothetical protein
MANVKIVGIFMPIDGVTCTNSETVLNGLGTGAKASASLMT